MGESINASDGMIMVKALEDGVQIIGMTRGTQTKIQHTENLNKNQVMIFGFTEFTSAVKISGKASIITKIGEMITQ